MPETIDHEARNQSARAMQAITAHEDHCGERWREARKAADDLRATVTAGFTQAGESDRRLHARIDKIIWALLVGAIGLIANAAQLLLK